MSSIFLNAAAATIITVTDLVMKTIEIIAIGGK